MVSVLVVDDSVVVRRMIVDALADTPGIEIAGTAANGRLALTKIDQLAPQVVTMDIEMPELDGIGAVRELRRKHPRLPVIMFSTLTAAGAAATLDALAAGATDYVTKPANVGSVRESVQAIREQLVPRILALGNRRAPGPRPAARPAGPTRPAAPGRSAPPAVPPRGGARPAGQAGAAPANRVDVFAIGCSTGGPDALLRVLIKLPADLPVPVVVVQHMPPVFTRLFADRLNQACALRVVEAEDNTPVLPGTVYIAPGDRHLTVVNSGAAVTTRLTSAPPENSCRPAVDVLFRSVAGVYGGRTLAVVLTGMGADGRNGCGQLRSAGAEVVVQDEQSSVVWGMPGAVAEAGLAHAILPVDEIARHLITRVAVGRAVSSKVVVR